jgi:hypothetical protein
MSHRFILDPLIAEVYLNVGSQDGYDSIDARHGLNGPGIESRYRRGFLYRPNPHLVPPSQLYKKYRVFAGVKRPKRGAGHSLYSSARLQMGKRYTFTSLLCLHTRKYVMGWLLPLPFEQYIII